MARFGWLVRMALSGSQVTEPTSRKLKLLATIVFQWDQTVRYGQLDLTAHCGDTNRRREASEPGPHNARIMRSACRKPGVRLDFPDPQNAALSYVEISGVMSTSRGPSNPAYRLARFLYDQAPKSPLLEMRQPARHPVPTPVRSTTSLGTLARRRTRGCSGTRRLTSGSSPAGTNPLWSVDIQNALIGGGQPPTPAVVPTESSGMPSALSTCSTPLHTSFEISCGATAQMAWSARRWIPTSSQH
jgi:hypothetical protein